MNGQLSEHPLGELIREISAKKLSGRLRLQQGRVVILTYFEGGVFLYAAANVRTLRLGEYLLKKGLVSEEQLRRIGDTKSDLQLAAAVVNENLTDANTVKSLQLKQLADTLRLGLLWTEGTWEFDHRSHLNEQVDAKLNVQDLFLEVGRRLPLEFTASRFRNEQEIMSLNETATNANRLEPREGFMLSRLYQPTPLKDLVALSGLAANDALRIIYSLALAGYVTREYWKSAFRDEAPRQTSTVEPIADEVRAPDRKLSLNDFLARVESAPTHYDVLSIARDASGVDIKTAYYDIARHYHPDRFRRDHDALTQMRVEAIFARITQAYETLSDPGARNAYDSKLAAGQNIVSPPPAPPKREAATPLSTPSNDAVWTLSSDQAELQFKDGLAALQRGQMDQAAALLAPLAKSAPNDARYRAYYGNALAANERTRRLAETELRAALKIEPDNPDYRTLLAELYRDLGFAHRARSEAERALGVAPNHARARKLLASLA